APGSALELVMEVNIPDGSAQGNVFFIGSNTDPETGPSYLSAADCGVNDPTPTGDIGFPDMHIVFNVYGSCPGVTPTPRPRATPESAATLNSANGADRRCSPQPLDDAYALTADLVLPPIGDGYLRPRDVSPTARILGDFNEGNLCAPSCDNGSPPPRHPAPRQ